MQKCIFLLANIYERGFKTGFKVLYLSFKNCPYHSVLIKPFDIECLKDTIFHHCYPSFESFCINDNFFVIFFLLSSKERHNTFSDRTVFRPFQSRIS